MSEPLKRAIEGLTLFSDAMVPRILTQICRDPSSPGYGSCDRNWWHYKIRDFSSVILQQAGLAAYESGRLASYEAQRDALNELASAACRFWNGRACRHGAFEEYYPWENGYPPTAFSTLAVARLVHEGIVQRGDVEPGLRVAAKQLLSRFEGEAVNQQVAGLAALGWLRRLLPDAVSGDAFAQLTDRVLALQHDEGWFPEYDGPDIGYLSVVVDCLWELYDATEDDRFVRAVAKAIDFIAPFAALPGRGAGMHNSRNTDYIVPYGIVRAMRDLPQPEDRASAAGTFVALYEECAFPGHFLHAIDDRYLCHYIGHSILRAARLLSLGDLPPEALDATPLAVRSRLLSGSGHIIRAEDGDRCCALISPRKGGVISVWRDDGGRFADFGWQLVGGDRLWCNHWWSDSWQSECADSSVTIRGSMVPHCEVVSSPLKHMVLRGVSLLLGRRVIGLLKEKMIFKRGEKSGPAFQRQIVFESNGVLIEDRISGIPTDVAVRRAPRASKRHVASADSYQVEDVRLCEGWRVSEHQSRSGNDIHIATRYECE
jgi:hypothetical protein